MVFNDTLNNISAISTVFVKILSDKMSNEEKERYNVFINMFRQPPFELPGMIIGINCNSWR